MEQMASNSFGGSPQERVRKYFRDVVEKQKLPALPMVAGKVLQMIQDPDLNVQKLCRVLSDDAALAGRVLSVSRSPVYAQRNVPTSLVDAVQVLGFRTLNNVVVASATHSLCLKGNKTSERLWNHALAVALTIRLISRIVGYRDGEQAFLAGLVHDVGEMILVHGDPRGFEQLGKDVQSAGCQMMDKEQEYYEFDHTLIGMTLLDSWNLDAKIAQGALHHHSNVSQDEATVWYHCWRFRLSNRKSRFGLIRDPPVPATEIMVRVQCDTEEGLGATLKACVPHTRKKRAIQAKLKSSQTFGLYHG